MKDYVKILENQRKEKMEQVITLKSKGNSMDWLTLKVIEDASVQMKERLKDIMSLEYSVSVQKVDLQFYLAPSENGRIFVKAQLFENGAKEILLKVFLHEMDPKGKSTKLARAIYHLAVQRSLNKAAS